MDIYIIRHGQTDANLRHQLQGRRDIPLNQQGREQATLIGGYFKARSIKFSQVYSSPLGRAMETARIVCGDVPIKTDDRLLEMDYGPYEGADLRNPAPEIVTFFSDFNNNPAPKGMEPLSSVVARAGSFLEDLAASAPADATVLISTHAIAMKGLLEYLTPDSHGSYWSKFIGNCAVYHARCQGQTFTVPAQVVDAKTLQERHT